MLVVVFVILYGRSGYKNRRDYLHAVGELASEFQGVHRCVFLGDVVVALFHVEKPHVHLTDVVLFQKFLFLVVQVVHASPEVNAVHRVGILHLAAAGGHHKGYGCQCQCYYFFNHDFDVLMKQNYAICRHKTPSLPSIVRNMPFIV